MELVAEVEVLAPPIQQVQLSTSLTARNYYGCAKQG